MGDTIEDMDIEIEKEDKRIEISKNKIGLPVCEIIEEMSRLGRNEISSKRKGDRITDRLNSSLNNHKYI